MDFQNLFQSLIPWFLSHGIKIVLIFIVACLANRFLKVFIEKAVKRMVGGKIKEAEGKRVETLVSIFEGTSRFVIGIVVVLMILPELGVNIGALLAGVGLLGLAVGMASKEIVSDFLSGLFIILEDQYHIGDQVKISGIEGEVKEITLRRTIIQDKDGLLHSISNSQIKTIAKKPE